MCVAFDALAADVVITLIVAEDADATAIALFAADFLAVELVPDIPVAAIPENWHGSLVLIIAVVMDLGLSLLLLLLEFHAQKRHVVVERGESVAASCSLPLERHDTADGADGGFRSCRLLLVIFYHSHKRPPDSRSCHNCCKVGRSFLGAISDEMACFATPEAGPFVRVSAFLRAVRCAVTGLPTIDAIWSFGCRSRGPSGRSCSVRWCPCP